MTLANISNTIVRVCFIFGLMVLADSIGDLISTLGV